MQYIKVENEKDGKYTDGTKRYGVHQCFPAPGTVTVEADSIAQAAVLLELTVYVDPNLAVKPSKIPFTITPVQARQWLIQSGISMASIDAMLDAIPDETQRAIQKVRWEFGQAVYRTDPMIEQIGAALGLDKAALDAAFLTASKIR